MRWTINFACSLATLSCLAGCEASRNPPAAPSTAPPPTPGSAGAPAATGAAAAAPGGAQLVAAVQKKSASGLEYAVLREGTGSPPSPGAKVKVHWTGRLKDGKVFGDTRPAGVPDDFKLTRSDLIDGLLEALLDMKPGERRRLQVPSRLGYGPSGYRGVVPSNADLEIDVELVSYTAAGTN